MSDFLKASDKWSATALQVSILAANAHFLLSDSTNALFALSALLVISLFSLQIVSSRFRLLYPVRTDFNNTKIPAGDTNILRIFLIASLLLLVLGFAVQGAIAQGSPNLQTFFESPLYTKWSTVIISIAALFLIVILPLIWMKCCRNKIKSKIARTIQNNGPVKHFQLCPLAKKDESHHSLITRELLDNDQIKTTVKCTECPYEITEYKPFDIVY